MTGNPNSPGTEIPPELAKKPPAICRHLGISNDPDTYFQYSSTWNYCHRPNTIKPLVTSVQSIYCLTPNHINCPVFQANWNGRFPGDWVARSDQFEGEGMPVPRTLRSMRTGLMFFLAVAALALLFGVIFPSLLSNIQNNPDAGPASPTVEVLTVFESTQVPTVPPTPAPTVFVPDTPTPSPPTSTTEPLPPTEIPLPTPGPGLGTPFGPANGFVIHVVRPGESFTSIANLYSTTPEVIQALNPSLEGTSLWVDRNLVIPIGGTDPGAYPVFSIFHTTEPISLTTLADVLGSDVEQLRYYNQLGESDIIPSGYWLVIPLVEE
jgi:hypothetical protein